MVISNLNHVEVISEKNTVEGGFASSTGFSIGNALGNDLSDVDTFVSTFANSLVGFNQSGSISASGSKAI